MLGFVASEVQQRLAEVHLFGRNDYGLHLGARIETDSLEAYRQDATDLLDRDGALRDFAIDRLFDRPDGLFDQGAGLYPAG